MRLADIADRLQQAIPGQTELFSDTAAIASIVVSGGVATVTTDGPHKLPDNPIVTLSGVETRTPIQSATQNGLSWTIVTSADHDLTEGQATVQLAGFAGFADGTALNLTNVANRRTFTVSTALDLTLSGGEFLLEPDRVDGLNGVYQASLVDRVSFTIPGTFINDTYTPVNGRVSTSPRIGVAVDIDRAREIYDEAPEAFWMFIIPGEANTSKDRSTNSDATAAQSRGTTLRLRIMDNFAVAIFAPVAKQLAAEEAIDICRHDLFGPIVGSLFGFRPDPGTACPESEFQIIPTGHLIYGYDKAVLVYLYEFQAPFDIVADDVTFRAEGSRAFRDITDLRQSNLVEDATAFVNLDETPLS